MSYMKLIKLLYLADRKALLELGRPLTFDSYVSMRHGPVLSCTLDLISAESAPGAESYWREHIGPPQNFSVSLRRSPGAGALSAAEELILEEIFSEFGEMNRWDIVKFTHELPEWQDPGTSCAPIMARTILLVEGFTEEEAAELIQDLELEGLADSVFG